VLGRIQSALGEVFTAGGASNRNPMVRRVSPCNEAAAAAAVAAMISRDLGDSFEQAGGSEAFWIRCEVQVRMASELPRLERGAGP